MPHWGTRVLPVVGSHALDLASSTTTHLETPVSSLIQVDARKRISLGSYAHHDQYIVTEEEGGRLILEPAVVLSVAERNFLADPILRNALDQVNATPDQRATRDRRRANV